MAGERDLRRNAVKEHSVAWCINDWQDMPSIPEVTANFTYFLWTGYHDQFVYLGKVQDERIADLQSWAETVRQVGTQVERTYGYFNNHYTGHAPTTANQFKTLLGFEAINPLDIWPQKRDREESLGGAASKPGGTTGGRARDREESSHYRGLLRAR